jgi:mRNA interferase HigB
MHTITRKRLNEFVERHPTARPGLVHWYRVLKKNNFANFAVLRAAFPHADQVRDLTVFNIGGNKARLICAIHLIVKRCIFGPCCPTLNMTRVNGKKNSYVHSSN